MLSGAPEVAIQFRAEGLVRGHERVRGRRQGPLRRRATVHKPGVLLQQTLPVDGPGVPGRRRGPAGRVRVGVIPFLRFPSLDCNSPLIESSRDDVVATPRRRGPATSSRKTPPQRVRTPDASPREARRTAGFSARGGASPGRGACTTGKTLASQQPREGPSLEHTRGTSPHARSALPYMLGPRHTRTFQSSVQPEARRGCPPLVSAWA